MVIQIKGNMYIQSKPARKPPVVTTEKDRAWNFSDLTRCKRIRDDVLEYYKGAMICS
jgi:hypothetical protein